MRGMQHGPWDSWATGPFDRQALDAACKLQPMTADTAGHDDGHEPTATVIVWLEGREVERFDVPVTTKGIVEGKYGWVDLDQVATLKPGDMVTLTLELRK